MSEQANTSASITLSSDGLRISCAGNWTISEIRRLTSKLKHFSKTAESIEHVDVSGICGMDSAGALLLSDLLEQLREGGQSVEISGLKQEFHSLFSLVSRTNQKIHREQISPAKLPNCFYVIGRWSYQKYLQLLSFFNFIGEFIIILLSNIVQPNRIQWRATLKVMDEMGYRALPIIALMVFLIGVVLTYQLAVELKLYGADIFVVDVSGVAILREFAPLITAIIMAGRTSTAFAALIGTMKVNEEIDALQTMGVVPIERLVLPRIFGLIFAMPLLTVWANIFGVLGSIVMAKTLIGIHYLSFLERFQQTVALKQLMLGMVKTPFFAIIIAAVGCFQGFQTGSSADSVGRQTTKSAVQAIFLIIVVDAAFSILYSMMGL